MCWLTNGSFLSLLSYLGFGGFLANGIKFWGYHFCKLLTLYGKCFVFFWCFLSVSRRCVEWLLSAGGTFAEMMVSSKQHWLTGKIRALSPTILPRIFVVSWDFSDFFSVLIKLIKFPAFLVYVDQTKLETWLFENAFTLLAWSCPQTVLLLSLLLNSVKQ